MQFEVPNDVGERWMLHMRRGEFSSAWRLSDVVLRARRNLSCAHLPRHLQWVWDGRSFERQRVLIRCYHGLGDTVHFIRYAPLATAVARSVTVLAQSELIPLLRSVPAIDRLLPLEKEGEVSEYDVDVEVMELPHVFRTTLDTIPAQVPYLLVPNPMLRKAQSAKGEASSKARRAETQDRAPTDKRPETGDQLRVGIVWAGGDWDRRRSIPTSFLAPLADIRGVELQLFQVGPAAAEPRPWRAVMPRWRDIVMEARLICALDLMISIDSLPAHLAGALGVPVWTLLPKEADWRWMEERDDSPWYPTMRLFRQKRAGDWPPVIAAVAAELAKLSAERRATAFSRQLASRADHWRLITDQQ